MHVRLQLHVMDLFNVLVGCSACTGADCTHVTSHLVHLMNHCLQPSQQPFVGKTGRAVILLQDDEDLEEELANAMPPAFRNAYGGSGLRLIPHQAPPPMALDEEEDDESPDEEEEEAALRREAPRLLAELNASINDAPTFRETQRRRLH